MDAMPPDPSEAARQVAARLMAEIERRIDRRAMREPDEDQPRRPRPRGHLGWARRATGQRL